MTRPMVFAALTLLIATAPDAQAVIIYRTFTTNAPVGEALAWNGSSFFATDGADTIHEFDLNGNILSSFASPASDGQNLERGLAFDGSSLWLFNRFQFSPSPSTFYELDPSNGNVLSSFSAPAAASNIFGLDFDGSDLVGPGFTSNTIVQVDRIGALSGTLTTNANTLGGMGFDDTSYVSFDFNFPVAPINQAWVRVNPSTGIVTGVDPRDSTDIPGHVFAYLGNDRWLMRQGFTSTSNVMVEASFEFQSPPNGGPNVVPEPSAIAVWTVLALFGVAIGLRRPSTPKQRQQFQITNR